MGSRCRAQASAPATTKLESWLDQLCVLEPFTPVTWVSHPMSVLWACSAAPQGRPQPRAWLRPQSAATMVTAAVPLGREGLDLASHSVCQPWPHYSLAA